MNGTLNTATNRRPRGMVLILAIGMLTLVAATLVLLSRLSVDDIRYTNRERVAAQLRQLLIAGVASETDTIQTPFDGATVKRTVTETADARQIEIVAAFDGFTQSQTIAQKRVNGTWSTEHAELGLMHASR